MNGKIGQFPDKLLGLGLVAAARVYQNILEKIKAGEILDPLEIRSKLYY